MIRYDNIIPSGKDWYHFTTGFQMMAEAPPAEKFSCGTVHAAYLNQVKSC